MEVYNGDLGCCARCMSLRPIEADWYGKDENLCWYCDAIQIQGSKT